MNTTRRPCGQGVPVLEIEEMPNSLSTLRYNINGVSTWFDHQNMIYQTQTDTILVADAIDRLLKYQAERHTDTISAKELGSILHIADLGDVDITNVEDNSFFVYQKDNNCGAGCEGINNSWIGWTALDHQDTSAQYPMAFTQDGSPIVLSTPNSPNQYYMLGWNAGNKLSYSQPVQFATADNKKQLYIDPDTKQIGYIP